MRTFFLLFFIVLAFQSSSYAQRVELTLKNGEKKRTEITANSDQQLYLIRGTINYSEIDSVRFYSEESSDKKIKERLISKGIKIAVGGVQQTLETEQFDDKPRTGDKNIILICKDSADVLFKRIGQYLALKGYAIENANKDLLTIKTALRETSRLNYVYYLNAVVVDNKLNITAHWQVTRSNLAYDRKSGYFDWEYTTSKATFEKRVSLVLYNDVMKNLEDFERLRVEYK